MRPHLPDEDLTPADVPEPDAPWNDIAAFGHRFHAYRVAGSLDRVAKLTLETHDAWSASGTLPQDLTRLRVALFHTVRAIGSDAPPDPDTERWSRALTGAIRRHVASRSGPASLA